MAHFLKELFLLNREAKELKRLLLPDNDSARQLVFYSEHGAYGKFFNPVLDHLPLSSLSYLTSDDQDPVFSRASDRFKIFYVKSLLGGLLPQLDSRALVMTMPDLEQYHIKRSQKGTEHIYLFHALVSTHMIYRKGAFDHYDTILCAGPHHVDEIHRSEKLYGLKPKKLVEAGYPLLDKIYADYQAYLSLNADKRIKPPVALIAPSWAPGNIMVSCLDPLVKSLRNAGFHVVIRPHPEFIKRHPGELRNFMRNPEYREGVEFEINPRQEDSLYEAAILVTDWSGIALEYAFGTERPVLFINTPRKVFNADYEKLGLEPLEVRLREEIGANLNPKEVSGAGKQALGLLSAANDYKKSILTCRKKSVFNFGTSAGIIADFLKKAARID